MTIGTIAQPDVHGSTLILNFYALEFFSAFLAAGTESDLDTEDTFYSVSAYGVPKRMAILVEGNTLSGSTTLDVSWAMRSHARNVADDISLVEDYFWTDIPITTSLSAGAYYAMRDNDAAMDATVGNAVPSPGMFLAPYLSLHVKNTGASDMSLRAAIIIEVD